MLAIIVADRSRPASSGNRGSVNTPRFLDRDCDSTDGEQPRIAFFEKNCNNQGIFLKNKSMRRGFPEFGQKKRAHSGARTTRKGVEEKHIIQLLAAVRLTQWSAGLLASYPICRDEKSL